MKIPIREYWNLLKTFIRPQWRGVLLLGVLLFGSIALQLVSPQLMRSFIDLVQASAPLDALVRIALIFLGVAVTQQVVAVAAAYASEIVGWSATNALRLQLARHCLNLDLTYHNAHTPGEMIERIDGDVTTLSNFFSRFTLQIAGNALLMVGVLVLLFRESLWVGGSVSLFAVLAMFSMARLRNIAVPYWAAERQASAELYGFLEERMAGTADIRANGASGYVMDAFQRLMRNVQQRALKAGLWGNILLNVMFILFAVGNALAFALGAYFFEQQAISLGTVYIIFQYTTILQRPIEEISRQLQDLQRAGAGIGRVQGLLNEESRLKENTAAASAVQDGISGPVEVAFEHVTFAYHDAPSSPGEGPADENGAEDIENEPDDVVLSDISFHLAPGKVLGLLGRTGSGKTSLTRLLFRLFDPDQGAIRIAQHPADRRGLTPRLEDIRQLPLAQVRRQVGMITQNIQLFNASVRDNLTFFDPDIQDEFIVQTLHELGLGGWYASLPHGLDTELESGGSGLSAGEAQLLAFARIFLRDPGLVILDEASSRLDPATEHLIERAVDRLVQDRTAIIIAHRLGTIQRADEILILENGEILEHGERAALVKDPGSHFYRLLQAGLEEVLA